MPEEFLFRSPIEQDAVGRVAHRLHGRVRLSARYGRGLPADVIPVEVPNVDGVGHAEIIAAMGVGFTEALVLMGPKSDPTTPEAQVAPAVEMPTVHRIRPPQRSIDGAY